ncbi:MAG: HypC/HybG/HupF family hydrogenase formation chaperone, partial [Oceanobacter sp.]
MCIGILMQVMALEEGELFAHCLRWPASEFQSQTERVDLQLVAGVQPGDWLLVFMGAAREAMTPERAAQVGQALQALEAVESGN